MIFSHVNFVLFRIFLFSEQNKILIKNPRQLRHKGNHFRAIGEGIKSIRLYMLEKYPAESKQIRDSSEKLFTYKPV